MSLGQLGKELAEYIDRIGPDSLLRLCAAQSGEPQFVANQSNVPPPRRNEDC
jgi:hypothetical protein